MSTSVIRSRVVNCARISSSIASQNATHTARSIAPSTPTAMRTPNGRQVCGSVGAAVRPEPDSPRLESESAGMDVGEQDGPRTDLVEVVHQLLGAVPRDHR